MQRRSVQERLTEVHQRLVKAREELAVSEEQLLVFAETSEEAQVRALVSESPLDQQEFQEAKRHEEAMLRARDSARSRVAELERAQDELLSKLVI